MRALARAGASHVTFHIDAPGLLSASTHQGLQAFGGLADLLPAQPLEPPPQDGANGHDLSSTSAYRRGVASALAQYVRLHGARAGLALSPSTPVDDAVAVCQAGGVDLVRPFAGRGVRVRVCVGGSKGGRRPDAPKCSDTVRRCSS